MRSEYTANVELQPAIPLWQIPAPRRTRRTRPGFFARVVSFLRNF
jgi:hypothetical protein